ncbi:hypothetical protein PGIGA_G00195880 [Pangasianodon gigas]|uniref:Uncharacterized protein n=1 Tax=Pangasianodon gigas TaxID=30993 RepID=A0ACC5XYU6_PANGG|nr:hypothetical protein [Pangasianodon gigas]
MPNQQGPQGIQALAISPDRRYLAVSECGEQGTITVYDLQSEQCSKKQVLTGGSIGVREFTCMAFSADSKYLLGQSGGPEWTLFYWKWEKNEVIATVKTTKIGFVSQVSFNPKDNRQICVSGNYVFKLFKLEKKFLNQTSSFKMDLENFMSHAWISEDCIVSGTETGKLLILKAGRWHKLRRPSERSSVFHILSLDKRMVEMDPSFTAALPRITAVTQYSKGFACASGPGVVCLYEKTGEYSYKKTMEIRIPQDPCSIQPSKSEQQEITTMCLSPSEETLAISTRQGQIYHVSLASTEISQSQQASFKFLFHSVHSGSITGLSTCSSKPLFATCSKDNSVRIWNYKTNSLELHKEFPEEPRCISLHPNGLSILVGFSDKVCLMNLLVDEFRTVQEFDIRNCNECVFNHDGNVFAAVRDNLINICNIRTGEKMDLNDHINKVQSVKWSEDDRRLVSCGTDGTVYEWNALTGACESSKSVQKSCTYTDAMFLPSTGSVLAVGNDFTLDEFQDGQASSKNTSYEYLTLRKILRELASDDMAYTAISMTHSSQAVFVGTAVGTVRVMQYPLEEEISWTEYQGHSGPITKMVVTPGDQYLLTASEDGTLLIWMITGREGRMLEMVKEIDYTQEVLCTKAFLKKKDQTILEAYAQMELLKEEQECKLNQNHMDYEKKIYNVRQDFLQQIEALKGEIQMLNTEKEEQKVSQEKALTEIMEKHAKELKDQQHNHEDEMFKAFKKHDELEQRMQAMQQHYEEKLREHEDNRFRTTMDMKRAYDERLQGQQDKLQQSEERLKELQEKLDSEFKDVFLQYDQELQAEKETSMKLEYENDKQMMVLWKIKGEIQDQCLGISQLEAKVQEMNNKYKQTNEDLKQKLKIQEQELCTERKRVRNLKILVQRMKADIQNCSSFICQPYLLRENFIKLHKSYIHEADVRFRAKAGVIQEHTRQMEHQIQQAAHSNILKQQAEYEDNKSEEMQKVMKENDEAELNETCLKYIQELQVEKETNSNLKYEMKLLEKQFWKIKGEIQDQSLEISMLKEEVQRLHDQHRKAKKVKDLTQKKEVQGLQDQRKKVKKVKNLMKEKEDQSKTIHDQEIHLQDIVEMHEKSKKQNEEDLISINKQLDELTEGRKRPMRQTDETEIEQLQTKIQEKKQIFKKLEAEVEEINIKNKETVYDLKQKLKMTEEELCTERQRVRNMKTFVERMKADIQNCSSFIQQPKMLKENFIKLHKSYIQEADVRVGVKAGVVQEQTRKKEHLQRNQKKKSQAMEAKIQQADCSKILKENTTPAEELSQERAKNHQYRTKIILTKKNVPYVSSASSRDSQLKSVRSPMTLPQLPYTRTQRLKIDIRDMEQGQAARQSSLGSLKLPPINNAKNTR